MAIKLKLATRRIPWSLALKSVLIGLVWLRLPFWAFLLVASYLYFIPLFRPLRFFLPFALFVFFGWTLPHTLFAAFFLAVVFYLLLGIKDLTFIERFAAYQVLELLLLFLASWYFFETAQNLDSGISFVASLAPAAVFFLLTRGLLHYPELAGALLDAQEGKLKTLLEIGVASFILWQLALALLFVPLGTFERSGLFLIANFFFVELLFSRSRGMLTRPRLLFNFSLIFIFVVGILAAAEWSV